MNTSCGLLFNFSTNVSKDTIARIYRSCVKGRTVADGDCLGARGRQTVTHVARFSSRSYGYAAMRERVS